MNNIQEKDWADDSWCGHTGMGNSSDYSIVDKENDEVIKNTSEGVKDSKESTKEK